jgi:hypothetical protein
MIFRKKDGGFSTTPLKASAALKPEERAACGTGHLMILCERAASGTLDKTVYPDSRQKPVGLTEAALLSGDSAIPVVSDTAVALDDVPPDPSVILEPEIPVLAPERQSFHVIPFFVRLVNRYLRPPLDEFPLET